MNTIHLKYIYAVGKYQSISKAATSLFISQPYLSKVLMKAEEEFNVRFFERSRTGFVPTAAGKLFLNFCERYIEMEDDLKHDFCKLLKYGSDSLSVAASPIRGSYWIPIVLPLFKKKYPHIEVEINEFASNQIPVKIAEGVVDLGVFTWPAKRTDLVYEKLFDERMLLMVPSSHALASVYDRKTPYKILENDKLHILEDENFISIDIPHSVTHKALSYLRDQGVNAHITITAKNNVTTYRLCEQGMGLAIIMEAAACNIVFYENPFFYQIGNPPLAETWYVAYRKGTELSVATQYFLQLVHECVPQVIRPKKI